MCGITRGLEEGNVGGWGIHVCVLIIHRGQRPTDRCSVCVCVSVCVSARNVQSVQKPTTPAKTTHLDFSSTYASKMHAFWFIYGRNKAY